MMPDEDYGSELPWAAQQRAVYLGAFEMSNDPEALSTFEDLQASPRECAFNDHRGEWAFEVHTQHGFPRKLLGILVIRGDAVTGALITTVE